MKRMLVANRIVLFAALLVTFAASGSRAAIGAGSLFVSGATNTPTHWNILIGVPVTAEIRGVSTSEVGSPLPVTLDVWIKSSTFGNTLVTATRIGSSSDYTFTWTPPAIAHGDLFDACGTTVVAYKALGTNCNNDLLDDGLQNGSDNAACGLRFVDAAGAPLQCVTVGTQSSPWSQVKGYYRD